MEIRFATKPDLLHAQKLMQAVFHDSDRFVNLFFKYFLKNNLLLGFDNNKVVSMAFLLPATLTVNKKQIPATYLYACATAESERGKGWMELLINRAWEESNRKGEAGLFLLPASETLYGYYAKLEFQHFFYHDRQEFHFGQPSSSNHSGFIMHRVRADQYAFLRKELLRDEYAIHYLPEHFQFIEEENKNPITGFYHIQQEGGIGAFHITLNHGSIIVNELLGGINPASFAEYLFSQYAISDIIIHTPGNMRRSALLRPTGEYRFLTGGKGYFCWGLE